MVLAAPQVRRPPRRVRLTAKDRVVRPAPPASDASVDPDAVRLAVDLPAQFPEEAHDFRRSASADAQGPQAVRLCQARPLLGAPRMAAACRCLAQDVVREFPFPFVAQEHWLEQKEPKKELQDAQLGPQDESVSPPVRLWEARSGQVSPQEP